MNSRLDGTFLLTATEVLRAIAHPVRIAIIDLLSQHDKLAVKEIHEALDIGQAVVSHHLRIIKDRGVVEATRDGKNTFYSLKSKEFQQVIGTLEMVI
ncbi:MAG: metalloregulator ArsR/SmtB family transcription factor [Bacteroidota bacterium]